jgi:protein-tyrosine kinase
MLIPKASHLVERVAERLLRSGALDDSAAQLLQSPSGEAAAQADLGETAAIQVAASGTSANRSSLFAPPPADRPVGATAMLTAPPAAPLHPIEEQEAAADAFAPFAVPFESVATPPPPPPANPPPLPLGPTRPLPPVTERVADFTTPLPATPRAPIADPAAAPLQGPTSVDAVSLERAGMVDWSRTRTRISEEFRLVQRQILRSAFGPGAEPGFSNLLLVTSARPGEGKSFMSTNLSGSIARQGDHHVLLVDADSKRDSICYSLGLAQSRGLLDLAANPKLDPAPLIVKTPIERLSILPVGRERERSAELFSTKEMTRLIQSLGRRYADRLLILDAPPCLSTSDPAVLAQVVGQILFVVEADRTQRDEIEASLDLIQACPTITMVLNKQQISSRYTFGAYSSYYSS